MQLENQVIFEGNVFNPDCGLICGARNVAKFFNVSLAILYKHYVKPLSNCGAIFWQNRPGYRNKHMCLMVIVLAVHWHDIIKDNPYWAKPIARGYLAGKKKPVQP